MKKTFLAILLALSFAAAPALADHGAPYLGPKLGDFVNHLNVGGGAGGHGFGGGHHHH